MKALLCFFFISARYLKILLLLKVVINYNAMTNKTAPKFTFTFVKTVLNLIVKLFDEV